VSFSASPATLTNHCGFKALAKSPQTKRKQPQEPEDFPISDPAEPLNKRQQGLYIRHERTHINENRYTCSVCRKTFVENWKRLRHERIHTREKLYACSVCRKPFAEDCKRLRHERIHTDEKSCLHHLWEDFYTK